MWVRNRRTGRFDWDENHDEWWEPFDDWLDHCPLLPLVRFVTTPWLIAVAIWFHVMELWTQTDPHWEYTCERGVPRAVRLANGGRDR